MNDNFSNDIKEVITISKEIALQYKCDTLDTSHLLLGIIKHSKNDTFILLDKLKETKHLEDKLINYVKESFSKINFDKNIKNVHLSRYAERALKTTFLEAKIFQSNEINCFHLILCILRNEEDKSTQILKWYGLDYEIFKSLFLDFLSSKNEEEKTNKVELANIIEYSLSFKQRMNDREQSILMNSISERIAFLENITSDTKNIYSLSLNKVTDDDLKIINKLSKLSELEIVDSILEKISLINKLNLIVLKINNCELSNINGISKFNKLEILNLNNNKLTNVDELEHLTNLKYLDISNNKIKSLSFLNKMNIYGLTIFFENNQITNISESILLSLYETTSYLNINLISKLKNHYVYRQQYENAARLRDIERNIERGNVIDKNTIFWVREAYLSFSFKSNPIKSPPIEIILQGIDDIKDFFKQVEKDKKQSQLFESKLLIIGEGGTGKTSFARKMEDLKSSLPTKEETTFNIDIKQIEFGTNETKSSKMYINIWDFGGQKIYRGTHQLFFSDKCLYVLVDDNREEKTDFSYWINTVQQVAGTDSKLIIIINQKHGRRNVDFDEIGYKKQFPIINDVIKIDLEKDIDELSILKELIKVRFRELPLIGSPLPNTWVEIRQKLANISKKFISFQEFIEICKFHSIEDLSTINTICSYFDNIGVIIYYSDDPILKERIYLNSNWLVETIYEVLDNEIIDKNNGIIDYNDVIKIWKNKNLELEIDRLCSLMNKFGLMYQISGTNKFVVPEKLPREMPYKKWDYNDYELIKFKYEFEKYNPKGMMSKLIVSLNKFIKNQKNVWHRGINIEYENTYAEIIETYSINNTFEIKIAGENKTGLLALIVDKFDEILKPYKNLTFEKYVQCSCSKCITDDNPHFFQHSDLLKRREKNIEFAECSKDYDKVSVNCLLQGIENNKSNMKKIEIFLASSMELKTDRDQLEIFINRENKKMIENGMFLNLNIWEDFVDSISKTRLQDEYNNVAKNSDIFISLFSTKVGIYTEEEFEVAHKNFIENNKPKHIYTFFQKREKRYY